MAKRKRYAVQRRYEVWVETDIAAKDFDDAVLQSKELKLQDYLTPTVGTSINDWSEAGGLGVIEM